MLLLEHLIKWFSIIIVFNVLNTVIKARLKNYVRYDFWLRWSARTVTSPARRSSPRLRGLIEAIAKNDIIVPWRVLRVAPRARRARGARGRRVDDRRLRAPAGGCSGVTDSPRTTDRPICNCICSLPYVHFRALNEIIRHRATTRLLRLASGAIDLSRNYLCHRVSFFVC